MFFEKKFKIVSHVFILFTAIHGYHIIRNSSNEFYLANEYFIILHNKIILKTIDTKAVFDEMWYIVEYFIVNIFPSSLCFIGKPGDENDTYKSCLNNTKP